MFKNAFVVKVIGDTCTRSHQGLKARFQLTVKILVKRNFVLLLKSFVTKGNEV